MKKKMKKKMKKNYILLAVALVSMMASCSKQDVAPTEKEEIEGRKMTMSATRTDGAPDSPDTRTSIDGFKFSWISTDNLGVFLNKSKSKTTFYYETGAGSNKATFTGTLNPQDEYVYAVYPSTVTLERNPLGTPIAKIEMEDFTRQIQKHRSDRTIDPTSIGNYAFMNGRSDNKITSSPDLTMSMNHLTTIFDFNITEIPKGVVVKYLRLAPKPFMPTAVEVNLDNGVISPNYNVNYNHITVITDPSMTVNSHAFTFRMVTFLSMPYSNGAPLWEIILTTTDGEYKYNMQFDNAPNFKKGMCYSVPILYSQFVDAPAGRYYPKIPILYAHDILVYDRNAGMSVPTTDMKQVAGNYVFQTGGDERFIGDVYTWEEALAGKNRDGSDICADGWRLPTRKEVNSICRDYEDGKDYLLTIGYKARLKGTNFNECFFPSTFYDTGYWSSDAISDIKATTINVGWNRTHASSEKRNTKHYVRCVKTDE